MTPEQMKHKSHLAIFASYYKPHLGLFLLDMVCALLICVVDLVFPYISRLSMKTLLPQGLFGTFFAIMAVMFLAYCLKSGLYFIVTYWGHLMGVNVEADMRRDLFDHMQTLSFSFFDQNRTGQLMSRITTDLFEIGELSHHGPEDLFIPSSAPSASCVPSAGSWPWPSLPSCPSLRCSPPSSTSGCAGSRCR